MVKLLTAVTLLSASPLAVASHSFFNRPLKLLTCELMLQSAVKDFSSKDNVLPALRDAIYKVRKQSPESANDGVTFSGLDYSGAISGIGSQKAASVIQRLNGIEENLTSTDLDAQIVSVEIRGEDIRKALAAMEASEAELHQIYSSQRDKIYSPGKRISLWALNLLIISSTYGFGMTTASGLEHLSFDTMTSLIFPGLMFLNNMSIGRDALKYNIERFDWNFSALKSFLHKVTESGSTSDFLIASSKIEIPAEFNKMLMAEEIDSPETAREIGLEQWGGSYMGLTLRRFFTGELFNFSRTVSNAGDNERNAYIDHVVFYDDVAKEPVWLFFYRAFRNQPAGRKPTERRQQEAQKNLQWAPGLSPIPALGK